MSGHSKWHTIKHKKGALDAKRGKLFTKLIKEITVAARTGEEEGVHYEEVVYEGYGPAGVAIMVDAVTDNRNRTVAEIRHLFGKNGGNLGAEGSVRFMFEKRGYIVVDKAAKSEDELLKLALEAGADDLRDDQDNFEILTAPENFDTVLTAVKRAGIEPQVAEVEMLPSTYIKLTGPDARQMLKLMEALEDHDDVQKVSANFDIDEAEMASA